MSDKSSGSSLLFEGMEWFEENKKSLAITALVVIVATVGIKGYQASSADNQAASEAAVFRVDRELSQNFARTNLASIAQDYRNVSSEHPGTSAAERALILSAATWLEEGDYLRALDGFEKYRKDHPKGHWVGEAELGQAVCLDSQDKLDKAMLLYQSVTNKFSGNPVLLNRAKQALKAAQKAKEAPPAPVSAAQPETAAPAPTPIQNAGATESPGQPTEVPVPAPPKSSVAEAASPALPTPKGQATQPAKPPTEEASNIPTPKPAPPENEGNAKP